jgi:hypothetical protein
MTLRRFRASRLAPALFLGLAACGDDGAAEATAPADVVADVEDLTGRSVYTMTIRLGDEVLTLDRDLDGSTQRFAFGSTHIGPAVSLAVTDSVTYPRTMTVNINFGIVVGSETYPIQTTGPGAYPFGGPPPEIGVFVRGLQYRSSLPGATGDLTVSDWSLETGGTVSGTFAGTLLAEGPSGASLTVEGRFHFTLPERQ